MYLIDTNVLSELVRARPRIEVVRKLLQCDRRLLFASEITRYELRFGAAIHPRGDAIWDRILADIIPVPTWLPIDGEIAMATASLAARLRQAGQNLDGPDAFIAGTALVHELVLVTRNVRHFTRVPDLTVENWFSDE